MSPHHMHWWGWAPRRLSPRRECNPLATVARAIARGDHPEGWQVLGSSAQARVARGHWNGREVYLKLFLPRNRWEVIKALIRGSRGARSVDHSIQMRKAGFPTPLPLCHGWIGKDIEYAVTEAIPHPTVNDLVTEEGGPLTLHTRQRWALLHQAGAEIARLHAAGWTHGDLRLGNILCQWQGANATTLFWYLDNEGNKRTRRGRERLRNLVQMIMTPRHLQSRCDQYRLLQGYGQALGMSRQEIRALTRRVEQARALRWQRRQVRGGPKARYSGRG